MSSLVDRLIRRTRDPNYSGIEPLLRPRFVPPAGTHGQLHIGPSARVGLDAMADPALKLLTSTSLPSANRTVADALRRGLTPATAEPMARTADRVTRPHILPRPGSNSHEAEPSTVAALHSAGIRDIVPHGGRSAPPPRAESSDPVSAKSIFPRGDADRAVEKMNNFQMQPATVPATANRPVSERAQNAALTEGEAKSSGPNVTITIGHIEVRAAQVAERTRRPAFRPRVSLDDFLSQRNGDRP
jgi:hypothetical protein